jgi:hypothetical protein
MGTYTRMTPSSLFRALFAAKNADEVFLGSCRKVTPFLPHTHANPKTCLQSIFKSPSHPSLYLQTAKKHKTPHGCVCYNYSEGFLSKERQRLLQRAR